MSKINDKTFPVLVDDLLKNAFIDTCKRVDRDTSQVLREAMRAFVSKYGDASQFRSPQ